MNEETPRIKLGTCAWSFEDWRGAFYPEHLPQNEWLAYYARHFTSVEVDSTFYHAPSPHVAGHWLDATPDDFVFSLKMPREITHDRKLRNCEEPLAEFFAGIAPLRRKIGAVLVQLPPYFTLARDEAALREFVRQLPGGFRFAIEFRENAWHVPRIVHLLEEHHICWAWTDVTELERSSEAAFEFLPRTTDFVFLRLLGDLDRKFRGDGSRAFTYRELAWPREASLSHWSEKLKAAVAEVGNVFVYINNHFEGFAPHSVRRLADVLEIQLPEPVLEASEHQHGEQLELL